MSFLIKALLAAIMSLVFVGLLPTAHADLTSPSSDCQPIYYSETMDGDHEVLICITQKELVYQYGKTDGEVFDVERFSLKNMVVKNYYVNELGTEIYEIYLSSHGKAKWYSLLMYSTDSKIYVIDEDKNLSIIELNQETEINNLWNLVRTEK